MFFQAENAPNRFRTTLPQTSSRQSAVEGTTTPRSFPSKRLESRRLALLSPHANSWLCHCSVGQTPTDSFSATGLLRFYNYKVYTRLRIKWSKVTSLGFFASATVQEKAMMTKTMMVTINHAR